MKDAEFFTVVVIVSTIWALFVFGGVRKYYRLRAVETGAASWSIDENGKANFTWSDEETE